MLTAVRHRPLTAAALLAAIGIGVAVRVPGFTTTGLYRADAWEALASRVSLGNAVRMSATAPGFTVLERLWLGFDRGSSAWAQVLPFILGVAAIPAVFALVRFWGLGRGPALLGAFATAVSPIAAQYSTHFKQYGADFLLACAVLWLGERARRSPERRTLTVFSAGSVAALLVSGSTAPVVAGTWAALCVTHLRDAPTVRRITLAAVPLGAAVLMLFLLVFRHLPGVLHTYWVRSGAFLDHASPHAFWHSLCSAASVLTVGLVAPAGRLDVYGDPIWRAHPVFWPAVGLVGLLIAGVTAGRRAAAAGLTLLAALAASFIGAIPLGTGRTDEVLYPAILLLALLGASQGITAGARMWQVRWPARMWVGRLTVAVAVVGFVVGSALSSAVRHPPGYPRVDVRELASFVGAHRGPGDWVMVDPYTRYNWALYEQKRVVVTFGPSWGAGYTVESDRADVFVVPSETWEDGYRPALWATQVADAGRLWYVGTWFLDREHDPIYRNLTAQGWRPTAEFDGIGGFAVLMVGGGSPASAILTEGLQAQASGQAALAVLRYQAVSAKDPHDLYAPFDLGVLYQGRNDTADASRAYLNTLAIDPTYKPALFNLAVLDSRGRPVEAISLYQRLLLLGSDEPKVDLNLGVLLVDRGQGVAGRKYIETAIRLDPSLAAQIPPGVRSCISP